MNNAEQMNEAEPLVDGIYFHMPEAQYHALERLSATGIKKLIISPLQYFTEHFDESFHRPETTALYKGKAYHKRILEGQDEFYHSYVRRLEKTDIDGVLDTQAELKDYCDKHGLKVTGTKPVLTDRILGIAPEMASKIFMLAQAAFNKEHEHQIQLTASEFEEIEKASTILEASDLAMHFSGGFPEISILWTDELTGVKCKARIDYLRHDAQNDLKTFSNAQRKSIDICVSQAIAYEKYNIQAVHYDNGLQAVKKMLTAGSAFIDSDKGDFINMLLQNEQDFTFVFQEQGQVNNCAARKFVKKTSGISNNYWFGTVDIILEMMNKYKSFMKSHGTTNAWYEHQEAEELDDSDFPLWMLG